MNTQQATVKTDWRSEWFEFEDVAYMNTAGQAALPKVAIRAAQSAIEWKKYPHNIPDEMMFGLPNHVRGLLAEMIGAEPTEIALTTGASTGMAAVAQGVDWRPDDEVLIARGEFPAHFATWLPMQEAGRLKVRVISPRGRFLTTGDLIDAITPNTRLISTSLVRFDPLRRSAFGGGDTQSWRFAFAGCRAVRGRHADKSFRAGRGFSGGVRIQMAAGAIWHGIFLDERKKHGGAEADAGLLGGDRRLKQFQ